jgi:hypothetical protein
MSDDHLSSPRAVLAGRGGKVRRGVSPAPKPSDPEALRYAWAVDGGWRTVQATALRLVQDAVGYEVDQARCGDHLERE